MFKSKESISFYFEKEIQLIIPVKAVKSSEISVIITPKAIISF